MQSTTMAAHGQPANGHTDERHNGKLAQVRRYSLLCALIAWHLGEAAEAGAGS